MSTPPRPRAPRKPAAERRADIAQAARALALAEGLSAVTLRGIATEVGVAPALVAHYEPSMDELVAATYSAIAEGEMDELDVQLAELPDASSRLDALVHTLLNGSRDDVTLVWVDAWSLSRRNEALASRVRSEQDRWREIFARILVAGRDAGEFEVQNVDALAWQIVGMIDGLNAHAIARWGEGADRSNLLRDVLDAMLGRRSRPNPSEND